MIEIYSIDFTFLLVHLRFLLALSFLFFLVDGIPILSVQTVVQHFGFFVAHPKKLGDGSSAVTYAQGVDLLQAVRMSMLGELWMHG